MLINLTPLAWLRSFFLPSVDRTQFLQKFNLKFVSEKIAYLCVLCQEMTLLHWACDRGHVDVVRYLIKNKADINAQVWKSNPRLPMRSIIYIHCTPM